MVAQHPWAHAKHPSERTQLSPAPHGAQIISAANQPPKKKTRVRPPSTTKVVRPKRYPCPHGSCGALFDRPCSVRQHVLTHTGEKPHACLCGTAFAARNNLYRHERKCKVRANMIGTDGTGATGVPSSYNADQHNSGSYSNEAGNGSGSGPSEGTLRARQSQNDGWSPSSGSPPGSPLLGPPYHHTLNGSHGPYTHSSTPGGSSGTLHPHQASGGAGSGLQQTSRGNANASSSDAPFLAPIASPTSPPHGVSSSSRGRSGPGSGYQSSYDARTGTNSDLGSIGGPPSLAPLSMYSPGPHHAHAHSSSHAHSSHSHSPTTSMHHHPNQHHQPHLSQGSHHHSQYGHQHQHPSLRTGSNSFNSSSSLTRHVHEEYANTPTAPYAHQQHVAVDPGGGANTSSTSAAYGNNNGRGGGGGGGGGDYTTPRSTSGSNNYGSYNTERSSARLGTSAAAAGNGQAGSSDLTNLHGLASIATSQSSGYYSGQPHQHQNQNQHATYPLAGGGGHGQLDYPSSGAHALANTQQHDAYGHHGHLPHAHTGGGSSSSSMLGSLSNHNSGSTSTLVGAGGVSGRGDRSFLSLPPPASLAPQSFSSRSEHHGPGHSGFYPPAPPGTGASTAMTTYPSSSTNSSSSPHAAAANAAGTGQQQHLGLSGLKLETPWTPGTTSTLGVGMGYDSPSRLAPLQHSNSTSDASYGDHYRHPPSSRYGYGTGGTSAKSENTDEEAPPFAVGLDPISPGSRHANDGRSSQRQPQSQYSRPYDPAYEHSSSSTWAESRAPYHNAYPRSEHREATKTSNSSNGADGTPPPAPSSVSTAAISDEGDSASRTTSPLEDGPTTSSDKTYGVSSRDRGPRDHYAPGSPGPNSSPSERRPRHGNSSPTTQTNGHGHTSSFGEVTIGEGSSTSTAWS